MTPAQKLRSIVKIAKGDDLERAIRLGYKNSDSPHLRAYHDEFLRQRKEWRAARDLLEELLKGRE